MIDDQEEAIEALQILLREFDEVEIIGTATTVNDGLAILLDSPVDVLFLDINMPGKGGFELLHELQQYKLSPAIIFTTAYDQYAIEAIKHSAFDYLLKPVDSRELLKAIRRFESQHDPDKASHAIAALAGSTAMQKLCFATRTGSIYIHPDEIIYVVAEGNYSEIITGGEKKELVTMYLKEVHDLLPGNSFVRVGRSHILNLKYLTRIDRKKKLCEIDYHGQKYTLRFSFANLRALEKSIGHP